MESLICDLISSTLKRTKCELKNRHDVINKSILRAVKRYFAKEFKSFHPYRRIKARDVTLNNFEASLKRFAKSIDNMYSKELYILLGFLLDSETFSEILSRDGEIRTNKIREFADAFSNC